MTRTALLLAAALIAFPFAAIADDEVRLDRSGQDAYGQEGAVYTMNDPAADAGDSGSQDLSIRIERSGFAGGDEDEDTGSGLSRDGGFSFGSVR